MAPFFVERVTLRYSGKFHVRPPFGPVLSPKKARKYGVFRASFLRFRRICNFGKNQEVTYFAKNGKHGRSRSRRKCTSPICGPEFFLETMNFPIFREVTCFPRSDPVFGETCNFTKFGKTTHFRKTGSLISGSRVRSCTTSDDLCFSFSGNSELRKKTENHQLYEKGETRSVPNCHSCTVPDELRYGFSGNNEFQEITEN